MTEKERLYGDLVIRMANGEDPYPALLKALGNIQKAFNFSPQFMENFNLTVPDIIKYEWCDGMQRLPELLRKRDILESELRKMSSSRLSRSKKGILLLVKLTKINEWLALCETNLSKQYCDEIAQIPSTVFRSIVYFRGVQKSVRETLEEIIEAKGLQESRRFNSYLRKYNKVIRSVWSFDEKGELIEISAFKENVLANMEDPKFRGHLSDVITYSLVEYFKANENKNYLKKCSLCRMFYIAVKKIEAQKYCPECSKRNKMSPAERAKYMRAHREMLKKKKEMQKRKETFAAAERLMKKMNISAEEALELIEFDKKM